MSTAKKREEAIKRLLKAGKLAGRGWDAPLIETLDQAITARRKGDKSGTEAHIREHMQVVDDVDAFTPKGRDRYENVMRGEVKRLGYFSFGASISKKAGAIKKAVLAFRKKGAGAAKKEVKKLHASMISSGEVPDNVSFQDFERQMVDSFPEAGRYSMKESDLLKSFKANPIISKFKLNKRQASAVKDLAGAVFSKGEENPAVLTEAEKILSEAGQDPKKKKDLAMAVNSAVGDAIV